MFGMIDRRKYKNTDHREFEASLELLFYMTFNCSQISVHNNSHSSDLLSPGNWYKIQLPQIALFGDFICIKFQVNY